MGIIAILILMVFVGGCSETPPRPECDKEYSHTIAHCPKKRRYPETPEECRKVGGVSIIEDGRFEGCVSSSDIHRILNQKRWMTG